MFEILFLIGLVMLIGFGGRWAFERTRIPEVIILMLVGIALGPMNFLSYFTLTNINPQDFQNITPLVGAVAIISMVFDSGLRLRLETIFKNISFSTVFAVANTFICTGMLTGILYYGFGWSVSSSLLLASILGGISSFAVYSIVPFVRTSNYSRRVLYLEGTLSTVLVSIMAITVMRYKGVGIQGGAAGITRLVLSSFSISTIMGLALGIVLLWLLFKFKIKKFGYLLTLSTLFIIYFLDISLSGIGIISIAVIGFVIGNSGDFLKFLGKAGSFNIDDSFRAFQEEISLFINTFFFVYLGLIFNLEMLTPQNIKIALLLMSGILISRFIVIQVTRLIGHSQHHEDTLLAFMVPRDLLSATLVTFAYIYPGAIDFSIEIVFMVITLSAIITSLGVGYYETRFKDTFLFKREVELKDGRKVIVRSFTKDDFKAVRQFLNEMVKEGALISIDKYVNPVEEKEMGKQSMNKINKGDTILWVGEYGKRIVARAVAEKMSLRERENVSLSLYVAKEFRGAGLGKTLLSMLISEAQRVFRPKNLYLTVYSNNKNAIKLYEKEGFVKVGVLPGWIKHEDQYIDRIFMIYRGGDEKADDGKGN